jgi:hypothetical protein
MKAKKSGISLPTMVLFGLIAAIMTVQEGYAQRASQTCSESTLRGRYHFASAGSLIMNGASVPLAVAGIDILDGNGNLSSTSTLVVNGVIAFQNLVVPNGTYTVNKDCTGTLTLGASGVELNIFVEPDGRSYDYVQTAPSGNVLAGTIRRVSSITENER